MSDPSAGGTTETFLADGRSAGCRIDKVLPAIYPDHSRSYFQKLIRDGRVLINGQICRSSSQLREEDCITVQIPPDETPSVLPEDIPLDILYEDEDLIIVNKPKGMVVHPAPGHTDGTLVNALLYHCRNELSGINGVIRPGIVHRIDRDTTGSLVVCKNDAAHQNVAQQISSHSVNRVYEGFVSGIIREDTGTVDLPVGRSRTDRKKMAVVSQGGRDAVTHFRVLKRFERERITFAQFRLETGRTHQIRVHMAHEGYPLLGDAVYGSGKNPYHLDGQALHARSIGLIHPRTGEYLEVAAPYPDDFEKLFRMLAFTPESTDAEEVFYGEG